MNNLTAEQQRYVLQFRHLEKMLAYMPGLKETHIAAMFGVELAWYRRVKAGFAEQARRAAQGLLQDTGFAGLVARLPFKRGQTVVAFGDSLTDDYQSWFEILRHLLNLARPKDRLNLVNAGISGDTTSVMISRFLDVVLLKPDWVLCMAGTNDARTHGKRPTKILVSAQETEKNLAALRHFAATQTKARWVWMTPPTVIEKSIGAHWFLASLQLMWRNKDLAAVARAVRRQGGELVDVHKAFGVPADPALLMPDGLHPSLEGQKTIVTAVVEHLAGMKRVP